MGQSIEVTLHRDTSLGVGAEDSIVFNTARCALALTIACQTVHRTGLTNFNYSIGIVPLRASDYTDIVQQKKTVNAGHTARSTGALLTACWTFNADGCLIIIVSFEG